MAIDLVNQKISCLNDDPKTAQNATDRRRSLLDDYLANPKLDMYDVVGMACDLLLAGVDTVSIQTYHKSSVKTKICSLRTFPIISSPHSDRQHTRHVSCYITWLEIHTFNKTCLKKQLKYYHILMRMKSPLTTWQSI